MPSTDHRIDYDYDCGHTANVAVNQGDEGNKIEDHRFLRSKGYDHTLACPACRRQGRRVQS